MSLATLGLRLALLDALVKSSGEQPTAAGRNVFDSRIGEINPAATGYAPAIVFSIEQVEGDSQSSQNGARPMQPVAAIVFALHVFVAGDEGEASAVIPETDVEAEDLLDVLAAQIELALEHAPWVRRFAPRRIVAFSREPHREPDTGERFAVHALTTRMEIVDDGATPLRAFAALGATELGADIHRRAVAALALFDATAALVDPPGETFTVHTEIAPFALKDFVVTP